MTRRIVLNIDQLLAERKIRVQDHNMTVQERSMTVQDLHAATEIRYNTLRQYNKNLTVRPDLEILSKLAEFFELDHPGQLFRYEDE